MLYLILGRRQHVCSLLFCGVHGIPRGSCGSLVCGMQNACVQVCLPAEHLQGSLHPSQSHAFLPDALSSSPARAQDGGSIPRGWGAWHCGKGAAAPPRSPPGYHSGLTQPAAACYSGNTNTRKQQPLAQGWERTSSTQHLCPRPCLQTL